MATRKPSENKPAPAKRAVAKKTTAKKPPAARRAMSSEHKAKLASGREQARHVNAYLEALEAHKPRRGRQVTRESLQGRLAQLEDELNHTTPMRRLLASQARLDLLTRLGKLDSPVDLTALEAAFVKHAKGFAQAKGITYTAWRSVGVPPEVLRKAGIGR